MDNCPFCTVAPDRITLENEHALAFHDGYPVAQRHTLVIPCAHVISVFDLGPAEQAAVWNLVGADSPSNMQWQAVREAKDKTE